MKKIRNYVLLTGAITAIPISYGLAIKTNDENLVNDNIGIDFTMAFATMSNSSTSSVVSASTAGVVLVTPYIVENNLSFATLLPSQNLWGEVEIITHRSDRKSELL